MGTEGSFSIEERKSLSAELARPTAVVAATLTSVDIVDRGPGSDGDKMPHRYHAVVELEVLIDYSSRYLGRAALSRNATSPGWTAGAVSVSQWSLVPGVTRRDGDCPEDLAREIGAYCKRVLDRRRTTTIGFQHLNETEVLPRRREQ